MGAPDPSETAPPLSLRLLGAFLATIAGRDATPRGRKTRALIAILALEQGGSVTRERLADLLWSDRAPEQARGSLRQALSELRLGPFGEHDLLRLSRDAAALEPTLMDSDLAAIERAAHGDTPARLAELFDAARGALLEDLADLSPAFDEWLQVERARSHERLIQLGLASCETALRRDTPVDLRSLVGSLERLDPGNEHVARIGLRADHAAADTASLHRRYQRLVKLLGDEFGVHPAADTRELFQQLTAAAPVAALVPAGDMPASPPVEPPIIMVSPVATLGGDDRTARLAEACTEDIRVALAQHRDLRVVGLDIADLRSVRAIGSTAVASYLLSCKLRRTGAAIRLTVQLGNVESGLVVWSEQRDIDEVLLEDAVDRIVASAAGAVLPAVERDLARRPPTAPGADREVVLLYLKARGIVDAFGTLAEGEAGAALLEEVIRRDPAHVGARVMLAQLYNTDFLQTAAGHDAAAWRTRALDLTREAAALEPDNVRAQLRLAWCHLRRGAWEQAGRGLREALRRLPFDAEAVNEVGFGLCCLGELDEAEAAMQRAFLLHPFPPATHHADYAVLTALTGAATAAEEHFEIAGEVGLLYRAFRLANLTTLPGEDTTRSGLAQRFVRDFATIWQGDRAPVVQDMIRWVDDCFGLRRAEHRGWLHDGLTMALTPFAPAGRDNSSS